MSRQALASTLSGGICAALFAFAFVAAPQSCEWGLAAYFWSGVAAVVALVAGPILLRTDCTLTRRILLGLAFGTGGVAAWLAGLFAANVRIICRLF